MLDRQLSLRTGLVALVVSLFGLGGVVAFLLGGEGGAPSGQRSPLPPPGTVPAGELAGFVSDQACASCHPSIFRAHHLSRHAITLHAMRPADLPVPLPDHARFTDEATGLSYELERRRDRYFFTVRAPEGLRSEPAEYLFGSGKSGVTLVHPEEGGALREFRMSYFHFRHRWEVTPGQLGSGVDPLGLVHGRAMAQRCFGCHSTVIAASQTLPEPRFMGVGCEACHGPGRGHIEALQRGDPAPHIENPGRWDGERVNALCGRCHRSEKEIDPLDSFSMSQTQRFQPLGLARSACFRQSAGRLTCITCHDAHENARTDAAHYEAACLSCHQPVERGGSADLVAKARNGRKRERDRQVGSAAALSSVSGRVCPVNPLSGCISCHMPNREVVRGISMADHWIRVVRSSPAGSGAP